MEIRRRGVGTVLVVLAAAGCASAPEPPARRDQVAPAKLAAARQWWEVLRPLGEGDAGDPRLGAVRRAEEYLEILLALRRKAIVEPAAMAVVERLTDNLDRVDLKGLYELVPSPPGPGGEKEIVFAGRLAGDHYRIGLGKPREEGAVGIGDYSSGARLQPMEGKEGKFLLGLQMFFRLNAGKSRPDRVGSVLTGALRWFENAVVESGAQPGPPPVPPAKAASEDGEKTAAPPPLGPEDKTVLERLAGSFPVTYPRLSELLVVHDVAWLEQRAGKLVTQANIVLGPDLAAFEKRYPKIHDYLVRTRTMRETRFTLLDARGRPIAILRYDGPNLLATTRAALADGKLVPLEGPSLEAGLDLERRGPQELRGRIDATARFWGLTIRIEDLELPILFSAGPDALVGRYRLDQLPKKIEVTGRLWGVFPVWLVDLLIPSNLERMIASFLKTAIEGEGGKGMTLEFRYEHKSAERNLYQVTFDGVLADNGLVQVQARLFKQRFAPRQRARSEIGDLMAHVAQGLLQDLAAYRVRVLSGGDKAP